MSDKDVHSSCPCIHDTVKLILNLIGLVADFKDPADIGRLGHNIASMCGDNARAVRADQGNVLNDNLPADMKLFSQKGAGYGSFGGPEHIHNFPAPLFSVQIITNLSFSVFYALTSLRFLSEKSRMGAECVSAPQET
ncbi:hypothetical protein SDC9_185427 [bioreactor metagenome]|uniref:Uncharacterized protein n=1 Tax=bioreactor metagenome TaxID=1076179 RepID=A0A645HH44_9ZZZZ